MKKDSRAKNNNDNNFLCKKLYNPNSYTAFDSALCFIIAIVSFAVLRQTFGRFLSFLNSSGYITDFYILEIISTIVSQSLLLIIVVCFCKIRHVGFLSGGGYKFKFDFVDILFGFLLVIGICFVFSSLHYQFVDDVYVYRFGMTYDEYTQLLSDSIVINEKFYIFYLLYIFILVPLLPAIIEEAMFRGIIMRGLGSFGAFASVILTSSMFMLMHGTFEQVILQFIGGLAITSIVYITKNFAVGCAMHFANNLFVFLIAVAKEFAEEIFLNGSFIFEALNIVFGVVFLIISVLFFAKKALVSYKNKLLGKQSPSNEKLSFAKIVDNTDIQYYVEYGKIDYEKLKNDNSRFIYNGKITNFNKCKNHKLEISLIIIGIIGAIVGIFLDMI